MKRIGLIAASFLLSTACAAHADGAAQCGLAITSGYGANGPYDLDARPLTNPGDSADAMEVFLPKGAVGPRPVIFFAHGFGPGQWSTYGDFIRHMVSRGDIVVFSSYPMLGVTIDQRYDSLWRGFEAAVAAFGDQMDLSRVAFIGHSFGGGAVPALAYKGLVEKGWGAKGSFLIELAPWYTYQTTSARMAALPTGAAQLVEVYADDVINDHRMAIDLYRSSPATTRYYILVQSDPGCGLVADHATPGRNPSLIQKQYAVFRPFDALADLVFNDKAAARGELASLGRAATGYQPLVVMTQPTPDQPESHYREAWTSKRDPRAN
jgi:pimeloyl-ACP methyl ester carboxylesterase